MMNWEYLLLLVGAVATVAMAVRIDTLKVPTEYILNNTENPEPLILDCEYDLPENERRFLLKWHLNEDLIYQWNPSSSKFQFFVNSRYRDNIDLNYSRSEYHKLGALVITKPTVNMTGVYKCSVDTYESQDRRSKHLQIIVPESVFELKVEKPDDGSTEINYECFAQGVFPEPELVVSVGYVNQSRYEAVTQKRRDDEKGLWDITTYGRIRQSATTINPSDIRCVLNIPNTSYSKKRQASQFNESVQENALSKTAAQEAV